MAYYFFDSSALVKRYAIESDSTWIFEILRPSKQNIIFVARIAGAEVVAALARKRKGKILTTAETTKVIKRFGLHFASRYQKINISSSVIESAMDLADKYELRGYDAIQLAAAVETETEIKAAGVPALIFVSFDADLNRAALAEGLSIGNP